MAKGQSLYQWCLENDTYGQKVMNEWTGIEVDKDTQEIINTNVDLNDVTYGSRRYFQFLCSKGHTYVKEIIQVTYYKPDCTECSREKNNFKVTHHRDKSSLYEWCLKNGEYGKQVINEWTGTEVDINGNTIAENIDINDIGHGSHRYFMFKCKNEHLYKQEIAKKSSLFCQCPKCCNVKTSFSEQFILETLRYITGLEIEGQYTVGKFSNSKNVTLDMYISELNIGIELSPESTHKDKKHIDEDKIRICNEQGIRVFEIIEDSYKELDEHINNDEIVFRLKTINKSKELLDVAIKVIEQLNLPVVRNIDDSYISNIRDTAINKSKHTDKDKALITTDGWITDICNDCDKNMLEKLTRGSNDYMHIHCNKCEFGNNDEWAKVIHSLTHYNIQCPNCGEFIHIIDGRLPVSKSRNPINKEDSVLYKKPVLAKEYADTNEYKLDELKTGSGYKAT